MIRVRLTFQDPNLAPYDATFTENEIDHYVNIYQKDGTPFPLIRNIQIARANMP